MKAATHLGLACAGILHWVHAGEDETISLSTIQDNVQRALRLFRDCGDQKSVLWSSFVADMVDVICQPTDAETAEIHGATLGRQFNISRELGEIAANVCLRLARKLRSGAARLQAIGPSDRLKRLLLYGMGLSEALSCNILLAQMHATFARLYVDVNDFAVASRHFDRAYDYAITEDEQRAPADSYKQLVDEILNSYVEANDDNGLLRFYDKLDKTWLGRFTAPEDGQFPLQWWREQRETRLAKIEFRQSLRKNCFHIAQRRVAKRFDQPLPEDEQAASQELFMRSNLGMNYGQLELARQACEKLDSKPIDYFLRVGRWEETPQRTWTAFETCVDRTAFKNSIHFLERLKMSPDFLNLSVEPSDHELGDYVKLVQVARVYIFQELWIEALALLRCSCSLVTTQRLKTASHELRESYYDSTSVERAFDWTVWVCLHFHSTPNSPRPKDLDQKASSNEWVQEALRYAELGKARLIGDSLGKQRANQPDSVEAAKESSNLLAEDDLFQNISVWLDPDTLVVHLTLCDEGLGLICLDIDGIHHAQWFSGLPGFGRWDVQRLTSMMFTAIESTKSQWWDIPSVEQRKIREVIEKLSAALIVPIKNTLKSTIRKRICFVPASQSTRIPFAALELDGEPLITRITVYQVPSLRIFGELAMTSKTRASGVKDVSVIVRATHDAHVPLMETAVECVDVVEQVGEIGRIESAFDMRKEDFIARFKQCDVLHVGTHGHMDYQNPLQSYIVLLSKFYVADLQQAKSQAKLIFLSACLTGLGHSSLTDDVIGFQAQILQSGALAFAGLIWNGHALASLFFSHFFYEHLLESLDTTKTLADIFTVAQRRLRALNGNEAREIVETLKQHWNEHQTTADLPPDVLKLGTEFFEWYEERSRNNFSHMYFWAPYTFIGYPSRLS